EWRYEFLQTQHRATGKTFIIGESPITGSMLEIFEDGAYVERSSLMIDPDRQYTETELLEFVGILIPGWDEGTQWIVEAISRIIDTGLDQVASVNGSTIEVQGRTINGVSLLLFTVHK
ncbi:MAG: hypothetical protein OXC95_02785, partial [Dehalococcoidia bacterium]|nr:hypothetical protein [Dehalococcoidia bacterium]